MTQTVRKVMRNLNGRLDKIESRLSKLEPPDKPERVCDECGGKFGHTCCHMGLSKPAPVDPKPEPECCGIKGCNHVTSAQYRGTNFCDRHRNYFMPKDVADNLCKYPIHLDPDKPECNCANISRAYICTYCKDKMLPLRVRVAKALGYKVILRQNGEYSMPRTSMEQEFVEYVPSYDTDLTLAMGALEEYCREIRNYQIVYYPDFDKAFQVSIWNLDEFTSDLITIKNDSLLTAICLTIVKHSEGAK